VVWYLAKEATWWATFAGLRALKNAAKSGVTRLHQRDILIWLIEEAGA
jgi:hypothetical protein